MEGRLKGLRSSSYIVITDGKQVIHRDIIFLPIFVTFILVTTNLILILNYSFGSC